MSSSSGSEPEDDGVEEKKAERGKNWSEEESVWLARSWLEVSEDAKTGADQKGDHFWGRVAAKYDEFRRAAGNPTVRVWKALKNRWANALNKFCTKFHGFFVQALREKPSGTTEKEWIENAKQRYQVVVGSPFNLLSVWQVLRKSVRWTQPVAKGRKKKDPKEKDAKQRSKKPKSSKKESPVEAGEASGEEVEAKADSPSPALPSDGAPSASGADASGLLRGAARPMGNKATKKLDHTTAKLHSMAAIRETGEKIAASIASSSETARELELLRMLERLDPELYKKKVLEEIEAISKKRKEADKIDPVSKRHKDAEKDVVGNDLASDGRKVAECKHDEDPKPGSGSVESKGSPDSEAIGLK